MKETERDLLFPLLQKERGRSLLCFLLEKYGSLHLAGDKQSEANLSTPFLRKEGHVFSWNLLVVNVECLVDLH